MTWKGYMRRFIFYSVIYVQALQVRSEPYTTYSSDPVGSCVLSHPKEMVSDLFHIDGDSGDRGVYIYGRI